MIITFKIDSRLAGFAATSARPGERLSAIARELLGPDDPSLFFRIDQLDKCLFSQIPNFPDPSKIKNLIVLIGPDLNCIAYVDGFEIHPKMKLNCPKKKGELIYLKDITSVESVDLSVDIPADHAVVVVQSHQWNRSLFFDFEPIHAEFGPREFSIETALAQQIQLLLRIPAAFSNSTVGISRIDSMKAAIHELEDLLKQRIASESKYQQLLESAPWMLGANYSSVQRHMKMDDENIPDFTATRAYDKANDVIEIKQPFLKFFKSDKSFSACFNDAWNQAERYLSFCQKQRSYLMENKGIRFENPRCILLVGHEFDAMEMRKIKEKEEMNRLVTVMSYNQLLEQARHVLDLVMQMSDRTYRS